MVLGQGGRPREEGVGEDEVDGDLREEELPDQLVDVGGEEVEEGGVELLGVRMAVEGHRQAVADELVADVEAPGACAGEDVAVVRGGGTGGGALVLEGLCAGERDDEAPGGQVDGEVDGRGEVTLVGSGHEEGVGPGGAAGASHFRYLLQWGDRQSGG
ncbi:unnamed protein product [Musa acuminata subsp. burmannicoides]